MLGTEIEVDGRRYPARMRQYADAVIEVLGEAGDRPDADRPRELSRALGPAPRPICEGSPRIQRSTGVTSQVGQVRPGEVGAAAQQDQQQHRVDDGPPQPAAGLGDARGGAEGRLRLQQIGGRAAGPGWRPRCPGRGSMARRGSGRGSAWVGGSSITGSGLSGAGATSCSSRSRLPSSMVPAGWRLASTHLGRRLDPVLGLQVLQPALERRRPAGLPQLDQDGVEPVGHLLGALPAPRPIGAQRPGDEALDVGVEVLDAASDGFS